MRGHRKLTRHQLVELARVVRFGTVATRRLEQLVQVQDERGAGWKAGAAFGYRQVAAELARVLRQLGRSSAPAWRRRKAKVLAPLTVAALSRPSSAGPAGGAW